MNSNATSILSYCLLGFVPTVTIRDVSIWEAIGYDVIEEPCS